MAILDIFNNGQQGASQDPFGNPLTPEQAQALTQAANGVQAPVLTPDMMPQAPAQAAPAFSSPFLLLFIYVFI